MSALLNMDGGRLPFPQERAWLQKEAMDALMRANIVIQDAGGRLIITDMWRSSQEQLISWNNWLMGRKTSYSPPPGASMHEIGRAVDIDLRDSATKIPPEQVIAALRASGWRCIALGDQPGHWHWEFRTKFLQNLKEAKGYSAMVALAFEQSQYSHPIETGVDLLKDDVHQTTWL